MNYLSLHNLMHFFSMQYLSVNNIYHLLLETRYLRVCISDIYIYMNLICIWTGEGGGGGGGGWASTRRGVKLFICFQPGVFRHFSAKYRVIF